MKISYGNYRFSRKWKNDDISWKDFCDRVSQPIRTNETVEEYRKLPKSEQDNIKDRGGFVGGHLKEGRRNKGSVLSRSMLTLDIDNCNEGAIEKVYTTLEVKHAIYTTHKHTDEHPRFRLVIPLLRDISGDEYEAIGRMIAWELGIDMFDDTTYAPERLMYWPTCSKNGRFIFKEKDGSLLNPDAVLKKYDDWHDTTTWPTSSRQSEVIKKDLKKVSDPLTKKGIVGAFCRAFTIQDIIDKFLSDIYKPSVVSGRYDYIKGESSAGVVIYDDKFSYSHHATDPASSKLLNGFDLVRIHKFSKLDENVSHETPNSKRPSFAAMAEFALSQKEVKEELAEERRQQALEDFKDISTNWEEKLIYDKTGKLKNCLHNLRLIIKYDEYLQNIVFNQLADSMEIIGEVPWKHPSRFWRDADDSQLICYVDERYGTFTKSNYELAMTKTVDDRSYHPIKEYFESLPEWDGVERIDSMLIDYLGADDNPYVRAISRKVMCAAVERIFEPGKKFDYILVLNGVQGLGKSTLISKLGMDWYSDSLSISDMNDKTAAEKLQGYWILEIGELAGMKKADIDKVKAFISRQDDKYRASFGRRVTPHPRQCIFFGTTNADNGYLRDATGNRRFWNVAVSGNGDKNVWDISQEDVDQMWAEAKYYADLGELLYLPSDLEAIARTEQNKAMERDEREGIICEYLDMLLPENWNNMDIYQRREYVQNPDGPLNVKGTIKREFVSNIEIWCECLGKPKESLRPIDSYALSAVMNRLTDWQKTGASKRLSIYGKQRIYTRKSKKY